MYIAAVAHHSAIVILKEAVMNTTSKRKRIGFISFLLMNSETSNLVCSQELVISEKDLRRSKKHARLIVAIDRNETFVCSMFHSRKSIKRADIQIV